MCGSFSVLLCVCLVVVLFFSNNLTDQCQIRAVNMMGSRDGGVVSAMLDHNKSHFSGGSQMSQ